MCLQAEWTSQLRTLNCQYDDLPSLNINSINSHWVHPDVLSRWLGKGTAPYYQSMLLCQLLKWRFKVKFKVNFKMNSKLGKACGFMIEQFPPLFGLSQFSPCNKCPRLLHTEWGVRDLSYQYRNLVFPLFFHILWLYTKCSTHYGISNNYKH